MALNHIFQELVLPLLSSDAHTKLSFQPSELSLIDISIVIVGFLLRSVFQSLGLRSSSSGKDASSEAPNLSLSMPIQLTSKHVKKYGLAVNPEHSDELEMNNAQLMLFLSSMTEPAMLLLLGKRNCPIRPLGAVNVRNRFELLRVDGKPTPLFQAKDATVTASLHSSPRAVKRGLEYDIETTLSLLDPETGSQVAVFRQVFTMLQFMKVKQVATKPLEKPAPEFSSAVKIPIHIQHDEPSNWAAISKDYNPIHIFALAARVYGFPGKLAHGNHVVAKAVHEIGRKSRDSARVMLQMSMPVWMEVDFKRSVTVPADLEFRIIQQADEEARKEERMFAEFEVLQGDKVYIEGAIGMLAR